MKKEKLLELKEKCCHKNMFGWTCGKTPSGKIIKCRSCTLFEELGVK